MKIGFINEVKLLFIFLIFFRTLDMIKYTFACHFITFALHQNLLESAEAIIYFRLDRIIRMYAIS